ncbi:EamA family transporter [Endozoicomonas ascidiicola]|uniref:EamA family transporter n=1 Tax=Endozoicomonas ascidiicola TaxID=1698521 RepID=UPI00082AB839|nr:EamA family transporter [Endozoicomonas ascidiicola]
MPLCFAFYGLLRKRLNVDAAAGLAVETLLLMPIVAVYFIWLAGNAEHSFRFADPENALLLSLAGFITTVPLVLFNIAARALSMTVLGIMQYLAPSISFLVGVFLYGEPLGQVQLMSFGLIWTALIIFTIDGVTRQRRLERQLGSDITGS